MQSPHSEGGGGGGGSGSCRLSDGSAAFTSDLRRAGSLTPQSLPGSVVTPCASAVIFSNHSANAVAVASANNAEAIMRATF